jgi:hypothetical protein
MIAMAIVEEEKGVGAEVVTIDKQLEKEIMRRRAMTIILTMIDENITTTKRKMDNVLHSMDIMSRATMIMTMMLGDAVMIVSLPHTIRIAAQEGKPVRTY